MRHQQMQQPENPILTGYDQACRLPYWASWQPPDDTRAIVGMGHTLSQAIGILYTQMAWSAAYHRDIPYPTELLEL